MNSRRPHSINILETPFSTVTSAGHWFHATRDTIEDFVPGLLKEMEYETLIAKAVAWIDSADSLAMLLYFSLAFFINPWLAAGVAIVFHYAWYHYKSSFVNILFTPLLSFINKDFIQVGVAAVALSFMGIYEMYLALTFGIIFFFLFKVGLQRRLWDKLDQRKTGNTLPLNDRVLKMVLVRYSIYENLPPPQIERMERQIQQAVIDFNTRNKK